MTAVDRAAEIIHTDFGFSDPLFHRRAVRIAEALAAAGLLVTDGSDLLHQQVVTLTERLAQYECPTCGRRAEGWTCSNSWHRERA
jgi:hypothetical protein